ncbi:hypothetical protein U1Q18_042262 [Sarracenia purpurea var. burkii]
MLRGIIQQYPAILAIPVQLQLGQVGKVLKNLVSGHGKLLVRSSDICPSKESIKVGHEYSKHCFIWSSGLGFIKEAGSRLAGFRLQGSQLF